MPPRLCLSDRLWACISAACLLGIAAFVVFVIHPGGFEGQVAWFFALLPGSIPAIFLSDPVYKMAPRIEPFVNGTLIAIFNFGWYWLVSFTVIKIFRATGHRLGSPEF